MEREDREEAAAGEVEGERGGTREVADATRFVRRSETQRGIVSPPLLSPPLRTPDNVNSAPARHYNR